MTVEQLNVIITAQTEDFQQKLAAVNRTLENTVALAQSAASDLVKVSVEQSSQEVFTKSYATQAELPYTGAEVPQLSANIPSVSGAAASVLTLRSGDTLIEAVGGGKAESGGKEASPIEIHTTVELDGEKIGEAVGLYNYSRGRITNGRS